MVTRPINYAWINDKLEKRILLVLNGYLEPGVAELIKEREKYYANFSKPDIEVWDLSKLSEKFFDRFRYFFLLESEIQDNFIHMVSSIRHDSYDKTLIQNFVIRYFDLNDRDFFSYRIITSYISRHSNNVDNPYALFYFAEYILLTCWKEIYLTNNFEKIKNFDELHFVYIGELKEWIDTTNKDKDGLLDLKYGVSEILAYSVRAFDVIRRICYYIYFTSWQDYESKEIDKYIDKLISIIKNNESADKPQFEINCIDLGIEDYSVRKLAKSF